MVTRVNPALITPVHKLRQTQHGVLQLMQQGRDKPYMRASSTHGEFVAWDGEGYSTPDGDHHYMLFAVSNGNSIHSERLTTRECLDFILSNYNKNAINVIYGGGYDATNWLRDLPEEGQQELLKTGRVKFRFLEPGKSPKPYEVEYMPNKWFAVTGKHKGHEVTVKIYDVVSFFQTSFINALKSRGLPIPEVITSGKAGRSDFTYEDLEEIATYCNMELELLVKLCDQLRSEFNDAGIPIRSYHGPGAVANSVLKLHKIKDYRNDEPDRQMEDRIRYTYFGGRFEQFGAGHYDRPVYLYDINSAYPYQLTRLPNLANGMWVETDTFDPESFGIWYCTLRNDNPISAHATPWRSKGGRVGFPTINEGVWLQTAEARNANVVMGYRFIPVDESLPFAFIADMYETRKEWKALGRGGEKALKLAMNSIYGKLAQTISHDNTRPRNHEMMWAAMITSGTRAMLWDAISQAPQDIIAVETDSVMSRVPLNLDIGENLGQWEETILPNVTYIQSGIYFSDRGAAKNKTRGINPAKLSYDSVMDWLKKGAPTDADNIIKTTETRYIGITNWNQRNKMGRWETKDRGLHLAGGKRIHAKAYCESCKAGAGLDEALHTLISNPEFGVGHESMPHVLPWLDSVRPPSDPEWVGEAVRDWETTRH